MLLIRTPGVPDLLIVMPLGRDNDSDVRKIIVPSRTSLFFLLCMMYLSCENYVFSFVRLSRVKL